MTGDTQWRMVMNRVAINAWNIVTGLAEFIECPHRRSSMVRTISQQHAGHHRGETIGIGQLLTPAVIWYAVAIGIGRID